MTQQTVSIVEVGPRDGLQPIFPWIDSSAKIDLIEGLYAAGLRRMEVTAFVSPNAVPQLADAELVLKAAQALPGLDAQVLVPNLRNAERAVSAGATHIAFVVSVSPQHNFANVKRTPAESVAEFARIVDVLPAGTRVRLNLATAFDCPFEGPIPAERAVSLLDTLVPILPTAEICPCDTTGRATPDRIERLFALATKRFGDVQQWAYHGHDTYGLGVANALAAWRCGIKILDASIAGLGGCPFAPGATGNVATEDLVWTFDRMGIASGIDLARLNVVARGAAAIPGANAGGRVRTAMHARSCLELESA